MPTVLKVYHCIAQQHDLRLVMLAAAVCLIACWTSMSMYGRALASNGWVHIAWLHATAFGFGSGVWATHFIAELAYRSEWPIGFAPGLTGLSLGIAIAGGLLGFAVAASQPRRKWAILAGGALLGLAIAVMHYTGMAAVRPATLSYATPYFVASLVIAAGGASIALLGQSGHDGLRGTSIATLLLVLAICGLHFTAMAAVTLMPLPVVASDADTLAGAPFAIMVAVVVTAVLLLGLTGAVTDQYQHRRFRLLADATFEGILFHQNGLITEVNGALCHLLSQQREQLIGRCLHELLPGLTDIASAPSEEPIEAELITAEGERWPVEILTRAFQHGTVMAVRDISERRAAELRIQHIAHHDTLTGLPNRALFNERVAQCLANGVRSGKGLALHYLDLDRFKAVNDLLGHPIGDRLLVEVANRISVHMRDADTVGRLGGDEFAIVQSNCDPDTAAAMASRTVDLIGTPFEIEGHHVSIGVSVGIAFFPHDGHTAQELLKNADLALHQAKQDGRGRFCFFERQMDVSMQRRRHLEQELRLAIERREFELHYQPLFESGGLTLTGYEALLRWPHPVRGYVPPSEFIPIAEETGLIVPLGAWVIETACAEAATWSVPHGISVNLSPAQFSQSDLPKMVANVLQQTGLSAGRLTIEITEGILIDNTERALGILNAIKALGVRVALDDFGTGYSSLAYLRRFPFDVIKIDRSFIQGISDSGEADPIVHSILALCRSLHLKVVAEGVETDTQLDLLRSQGCDLLQGYLLGRPMAAENLPAVGPTDGSTPSEPTPTAAA
jgi:diguanylate cyclase (GGDEF)-like protein/PAS domain S-box-containing protein